MYEVRWAHTAVADLRTKVRSPTVQRYLLAVARTALDRPPGEWGGRVDAEMWWRRGVAPEHEDDPDAVPTGVVDGVPERPYDLVLVYLRSLVARTPRSMVVIGVVTNHELAAGIAGSVLRDGLVAHTPRPARSPRGRRLTRPRGGGAGDRR